MPNLQPRASDLAHSKITSKTRSRFAGPLLVTGSSRSGTSYLRRVANHFEEVHLEYELDILRGAREIWRQIDVTSSKASHAAVLNGVMKIKSSNSDEKFCNQSPEFYDQLYLRCLEHRSFAKWIEDLYRGDNKNQIWGDKCELSQVSHFLSVFPDCKVIFIIRDPRAVASSFFEHSGVNCITTSLAWVSATRLAGELIVQHGTGRIMLVRYEDLLSNLLATMLQISKFIGQPVPDGASEFESPQLESLRKWHDRLPDTKIRQIEEICFDEMHLHNYRPVIATSKRKISKITYSVMLVQHSLALLKHRRLRFSDISGRIPRLARYYRFYRTW